MGRKKLKRAQYLSFATYRKSGVAVETPVWFAEEDDCFYLFSAEDAGKIKRLRNSPASRIAPCTVTGRVTGEWVETEAEILTSAQDIDQALGALRRRYGWKMRMTDCLSTLSGKMGHRAYIRVRPVSKA